MTNFGTLTLLDVVMHEVPRNARVGNELRGVVLTDRVVDLTDDDRAFLTRRFRETLQVRSRPVVRDSLVTSDTPDAILRTIAQPDRLVEESRTMTTQLAQVQPGSSNLGLVVVANCRLDDSPGVLVAKVEHQEAMRLEASTDGGGTYFTVEHLRDLVFGESARIYKVAVFSTALSAGAILSGEAVDQQNGLHPASFFMSAFLGMKLRENPDVLTELFLNAATQAVNDAAASAEQKAAMEGSIIAELQRNVATLDPRRFVTEHIPTELQNAFAASMAHEGLPMREFGKDTRLVESRLKRIRIQLENGVSILAPPDEVGPDGSVRLSRGENETIDQVVIDGRITDIASSGART